MGVQLCLWLVYTKLTINHGVLKKQSRPLCRLWKLNFLHWLEENFKIKAWLRCDKTILEYCCLFKILFKPFLKNWTCPKLVKNIVINFIKAIFKSKFKSFVNVESWTKRLQIFSLFSPHHKWNGNRLLPPESECKSCLTICQMT